MQSQGSALASLANSVLLSQSAGQR
jgi:hypothetical protein